MISGVGDQYINTKREFSIGEKLIHVKSGVISRVLFVCKEIDGVELEKRHYLYTVAEGTQGYLKDFLPYIEKGDEVEITYVFPIHRGNVGKKGTVSGINNGFYTLKPHMPGRAWPAYSLTVIKEANSDKYATRKKSNNLFNIEEL